MRVRAKAELAAIKSELQTIHCGYVTIYAPIGGYYQGILVCKDGVNQTASPMDALNYLLKVNRGNEVRIKLYDRQLVSIQA